MYPMIFSIQIGAASYVRGVAYFYQRAELPLINGSWSHLAGGCVNSHVLKFCKSGLIEVFRDQIDMLTLPSL